MGKRLAINTRENPYLATPERSGASLRKALLCIAAIIVISTICVICGVTFHGFGLVHPLAEADDAVVARIEDTYMHARNRILLNGMTTLRTSDIQITNGHGPVDVDLTLSPEAGMHEEYVVDMTDADTRAMAVTATYRNIGTDPLTGRAIGCRVSFTNFILAPDDYWQNCANWYAGKKLGELVGHVPDTWHKDAMIMTYPQIRLAANFDGGFWLLGVEHAKVDMIFFYGDNPQDRVDLSQAFLTIQSLDYDGNSVRNPSDGRDEGNEAARPENIYEKIFLTPESLVGRWGDIIGFSGTVYPSRHGDTSSSDEVSNYFYQKIPNSQANVGESERAITLYGVKNGSNQFTFDVVDTESWFHFMPYFGTIGAVEPPALVKDVDDSHPYKLGDTVQFSLTQEVPGRNEMLGKYTKVLVEDDIPQELRVDKITVLREDGTEVSSGQKSAAGENHVSYQFDLAAEEVYGHTYTILIDTTVIDYPADPGLTLKNKASATFSDHTSESNEVAIELVPPELQVEKHADLTNKLASAIAGFEYLSHDQHPDDHSTVHFVGVAENVVDGTRARSFTIEDTLPQGLSLVKGSVKASGAEGLVIKEQENGFQITGDALDVGVKITFEYDATTTDAGNGKEIVNTVRFWAENIPHDLSGAKTTPATDDGEVYINDPVITIKKMVSESAVQNSDYQETGEQQREEYRVSDKITYTVVVENTAPGTFAHNLRIADEDMPEGFTLVGDVRVTGLDEKGSPKKLFYPMAGVNDTIHDEGETRSIHSTLEPIRDAEQERWGWELNIDYLPASCPVTITWTVEAGEQLNGWEIYNQANVTAENQPGDTELSEKPCVWINTPEFVLDKAVEKTDAAYQVGSIASYDVTLFGLKTPGTVARHTALSDEFITEGCDILERSFVITDKEEGAQDIHDQVDLHRSVGENRWSIDMAQVYDDETGYWVNTEKYFVWDAGTRIEKETQNPLGVSEHHYFKVHYEAAINDMALQNDRITNTARATSDEGYPQEDTEEVTVIGPQLSLTKTSTDDGSFEVGEVATYELTVRNLATGTVAENVVIQDDLATAKAGAAEIVDGSLALFDGKGEEIESFDIEYRDNEAQSHIGFVLTTHQNLSSSDELIVRYQVKYLTNNGFDVLRNVAFAWADNAPKVTDDHETWPADADQSDLVIDKGSDRFSYQPNDIAEYTLHVTNSNTDEAARNVVIRDDLDEAIRDIAELVQGSVQAFDESGNAISGRVTYHANGTGGFCGFTLETERDLSSDEAIDVKYQVRFHDDVEQPTVVHNESWAAADNTGRATDDNEVTVGDEIDPTQNSNEPFYNGMGGDDWNPGYPTSLGKTLAQTGDALMQLLHAYWPLVMIVIALSLVGIHAAHKRLRRSRKAAALIRRIGS